MGSVQIKLASQRFWSLQQKRRGFQCVQELVISRFDCRSWLSALSIETLRTPLH